MPGVQQKQKSIILRKHKSKIPSEGLMHSYSSVKKRYFKAWKTKQKQGSSNLFIQYALNITKLDEHSLHHFHKKGVPFQGMRRPILYQNS